MSAENYDKGVIIGGPRQTHIKMSLILVLKHLWRRSYVTRCYYTEYTLTTSWSWNLFKAAYLISFE